MNEYKTKCFLSNISYYVSEITPDINNLYKLLNIDQSRIKLNVVLEYCIKSSLSNVFCLPVVFQKQNGIFIHIYSAVREKSDRILFNQVDRTALNIFTGQDVVVLINNVNNTLVIKTY